MTARILSADKGLLNEGDVISMINLGQEQGQRRWLVCETVGNRTRIRPINEPFNDACGDYWIVINSLH